MSDIILKMRLVLVLCFSGIAIVTIAQERGQTKNTRLVVNYYPNGRIKEKGEQGYYENKVISTGIYTGTWSHYDINGKLIALIKYHNDVPTKAYIEKTKYHPNGKISSVERFNNYELYESKVDSIGAWKYYNSKGKLIKKITH